MKIEEITFDNINKICKELVSVDRNLISALGDTYSAEKWNETNFIKDIPGKWKLSSFVNFNGKIVGFCICSFDLEKKAHINRIGISSDICGIGIGSKLLDFTEKRAIDLGISEINLFVNEKNMNAISFYKKRGFCIMSGSELIHRMRNAGKVVDNELFVLDTDTNTKLLFMTKYLEG